MAAKGFKPYGDYNLALYDIDNDVALLDSWTDVALFSVNYEPCSIPSVVIDVTTHDNFPDTFYKVKNIGVSICWKEDTQYTWEIGIDKLIRKKEGYLEIKGFLCKYEDFNDISTAYLGGTLEEALQTLAIRENLGNISEITQDFYQIQESKIQAFLRILKGAAQNSIFTLTDDSVLLTNFEDQTGEEQNEILTTDPPEFFYKNRKMKDLVESPTNILSYDSEKSGLSMHTAFGYTYIDVTDFSTSLLNRATSVAYSLMSTDILIKMKYNNLLYPYNIGDTMKISSFKGYSGNSLRILNKSFIFTQNAPVYSSVLYSGVSVDED